MQQAVAWQFAPDYIGLDTYDILISRSCRIHSSLARASRPPRDPIRLETGRWYHFP
jgi:hypothetical protein